jgi:hypothetical protein
VVARRNELAERLFEYAQKYGFRREQTDKGLEAYAVHLFAQEDGLDPVLDGQATIDADLSEYILRSDDLGVDGVLTDIAGKRIVLIQCTTQSVENLEGKLTGFTSVLDRVLNPALIKKAGEPAQELLGSLSDQLEDDYSVELRFVSNRALGSRSRLREIVEAANNSYDDTNRKITLELYGGADLLQLERDLDAATTGSPVGTVSFSVQRDKLLQWGLNSDAPRETLIALIKGNELANLYGEYGNKLFASNIRLPLLTKKVNPEIKQTAEESPQEFFYYNNGVSAVCKTYELEDTRVTATGFQVINGAQTVDALRRALRRKPNEKIYVLFRLTASESYGQDKDFTENVIRYNNTQNPVKAYDFFSNDPIQIWISRNLDALSGKKAMPAFFYVHKSGYKPRQASGRKQLKIDAFAGIRHAFLYGPVASYREPATFFDRDQRYGEAFGVNGKIYDSWDDEILAEAACAIAINDKIQRIAREVQATERELRKQSPEKKLPEARYLYRLARYVAALVGVGLRAIIPSKLTDFSVLMASQASFDKYTIPLIERARDLVNDEMVERLQGSQLQSAYNFARDEKAWGRLETRMESAALTRIDFDKS